ncbi:MAG TPA: type II secretion system protein N [Steroidobacteraceae bacterium]|nr:type II secretion system protein N [Steroidobacteraceae bacterium]
MKHRTGWLLALGILALLAFALVTLPAAVLSGPLGNAGFTAAGYAGSVWSGSAQGLAWQGAALGDLAWSLTPSRLLGGRLAGHAKLARPDGSLDTNFDVALSVDDVRLEDLQLALPIEALNALPLGMPKGWRGRASGAFEEVRLADGRPAALRGSLDIDGLVAPPPRNAPLGSFRAVFPHPQPQPSLSIAQDPGNLTAQVTDKDDGPFAVDAQLTVSAARMFSLEGTLAPRGAVPPAMQQSLQLLGPADASGRRQFSVGGTL